MKGLIPVAEIFGPTISGEGSVLGVPTMFIRTGGCDFRCSWCDSLHAVLPSHRKDWERLSSGVIVDKVVEMSKGVPMLVTLSGGNPAMHAGLGDVITELSKLGYKFNIETQGTVYQPWFFCCDYVTLSPKPPSSGMPFDPRKLRKCIEAAGGVSNKGISIKIPVFDLEDLRFAQNVQREFPLYPLYLSVGNVNPPDDDHLGANDILKTPTWLSRTNTLGTVNLMNLLDRYEWLCTQVLALGIDAIVRPQMHVLIWGNERAR